MKTADTSNNSDPLIGKTPSPRDRRPNEGSALVVSLALLVAFAIFGMTFLIIAGQEQRAAEQELNEVRARMLAQTGVQEVIQLTRSDQTKLKQVEYNELKNGRYLDNISDDPSNVPGIPENYQTRPGNVDPKYARKPSRHEGTIHVKLSETQLSSGTGIELGYSGELPPSVQGGRDTYSIRITANSSKINVDSNNAHMEQVINHLYEQITGDESVQPGTAIREAGTKKNFTTVEELCCDILTRDVFDVLERYLTVENTTWLDNSVVKPDPFDPEKTSSKTDLTALPPDGSRTINYRKKDYRPQPRAPVNVNSADQPVLTALIQGLEAHALVVDEISNTPVAQANHSFTRIGPIQEEEAEQIAEEIITYREQTGQSNIIHDVEGGIQYEGPFRSWPEFEAFVDRKLVEKNIISRRKGYLLKANFNPNTRIGKLNFDPNGTWSWTEQHSSADGKKRFFLDKTDFTYHTTEFTFFSTGYYELKSYGRITDKAGNIVAESSLRATIRPFKVKRMSSQQDFLTNARMKEPTKTFTVLPEMASVQEGNYGSTRSGKIGFPTSTQNSKKYSRIDLNQLTRSSTGTSTTSSRNVPTKRDLTGEGLLIGSDRGRVPRINTAEPRWEGMWDEGHIEFWWKPKTFLELADRSTKQNLGQYGQAMSDGEQLVLAEMMFLADEARNIAVPKYNNTEIRSVASEGESPLWFLQPGSSGRGSPTGANSSIDFLSRTLPVDTRNKSYANQLPDDEIGNSAGYYIKFWIQDDTFYFLVRFRSVFKPEQSSGTLPTMPRHDPLDASITGSELVGGATLAKMPVKDAQIQTGEWNKIVLNWKPETHKNLKYMGEDPDATETTNNENVTEEGVQVHNRDVNLVTGRFSINGIQLRSSPDLWAEGQIMGNKVLVSNFLETSYKGEQFGGPIQAGWPVSWTSNGFYTPSKIGPKRLKKPSSIGHIGGLIRERGKPLKEEPPVKRPEQNYRNWRETYAEGTVGGILVREEAYREGNEPQALVENRYSAPRTNYRAEIQLNNALQSKEQPAKITKIGFTQYEPLQVKGAKLGKHERPHFYLKRIEAKNKYTNTPSTIQPRDPARTGALVSPGKSLSKLKEGRAVEAKNSVTIELGSRLPTSGNPNATPYVEDLTIIYTTPGQNVLNLHYYKPTE